MHDPASELLEDAVALRASDLHLDPEADGLAVRLRVDGRFTRRQLLDRDAGERLIGRLKVMAGLMVYRCDIPQEGRLQLPGGREGRLALIPTLGGEKATVRVFDAECHLRTLDDLGFDAETMRWLGTQLGRDHGLVAVVGPSGSGKTTTLYAAMSEIVERRGDFCHVTSIEDPIERRIPGCTQVQVDPVRALDFAAGLKFLLRQDPEVVMVGEVRDADTARVAVRAAMTGHLVLTTMHCGRAAEARPRLLEMGAEPWAVDLAFAGAMAQRLLRRLCPECSGSGCETCLGSGFRGRVVVCETLDGDQASCGRGLTDAAQDLVGAGLTRNDEVTRVLGGAQ